MTTFSINRKTLQTELSLLSGVSEKKGTIPILSSVKMDWAANLTLTASSIDITLVSIVDLPQLLTPETDSFCLPLRELRQLVSLFESDDVSFSHDGERIVVCGGKSRHKLPFWESDKFPEVDTVTNIVAKFTVDELVAALTRVIPCASTEDNCPLWQYGVQMEGSADGLALAASDSHRLGYEVLKADVPTFTALVHSGGLRPLLNFLDGPITVEVGSNHASFQSGQRKLITGLVAGNFPAWRQIVPTNPHSVQFGNEQLGKALKRVAVTRDERQGSGMKFTFASDSLTVETQSQKGEGIESIAITSMLNGDSITLGLNPDYLNSYLANAGERVTCALKDERTALMFSEAGSSFKYVLMTMRVGQCAI